jgi:hypothetical protein
MKKIDLFVLLCSFTVSFSFCIIDEKQKEKNRNERERESKNRLFAATTDKNTFGGGGRHITKRLNKMV